MNWSWFTRKLLLLNVYGLCPIDVDLTLDPNDPDEPYAAVILSISTILIVSLLKYESVPNQETNNILVSLYLYFSNRIIQSSLHHNPL